MSNSIYATLSRQDGLLKELQVVANNIANTNTAGYKTDRAVFAEYLMATGADSPSLSMGGLAGHSFDLTQGTVKFTGGQFDLALQGEGFFAIETDAGQRLTRAGGFQLSADGELITGDGARVLSRAAAIREAQELVRRYVPEGVSLVDELLAERRAEAAREGR